MYNPQAALFAQAVIEIQQIVRIMGGNESTATGFAGVGDLFVTAFGGRTSRLARCRLDGQ